VALQLRRDGFKEAYALSGGFDAWREAHLPLEPLRATEARETGAQHQPL
jgi:rhodanese-related sulfurtransferase